MVSPMVMVRGGVIGVLWVRTRPVEKDRNTSLTGENTASTLGSESVFLRAAKARLETQSGPSQKNSLLSSHFSPRQIFSLNIIFFNIIFSQKV